MKTRNGFVSNSSSSSFVVIGNAVRKSSIDALRDMHGKTNILRITGEYGNTEFGWERTRYDDFWSRLNFAYFQAEYMVNIHPRWMEMLERVMKHNFIVNAIEWNITATEYPVKENKIEGYIDHQSSATEGENTEMFADDETLFRFLFSDESYIQGDNDNH